MNHHDLTSTKVSSLHQYRSEALIKQAARLTLSKYIFFLLIIYCSYLIIQYLTIIYSQSISDILLSIIYFMRSFFLLA